jgi:cephalosporin-C deacetylase-like acetyl esterase
MAPVKEPPAMTCISRRELLAGGLAIAGTTASWAGQPRGRKSEDVHRQILDLAARQQDRRRARFAAVRSKEALQALQASLRETFIRLLGEIAGSPGLPAVRTTGTIDAGDYAIEKLLYESFPGYFVPALLYRPSQSKSRLPGVLSPCGHSTNGKAAGAYQVLHINLAKRGYVVLTYDPVGQGERSQFWNAASRRSRFNLSCGEHAVLGNPLYLLATSLARYRIWDGLRGLDYLASRPEVDPACLGCVGNSGGGTLTAYIAALDPRVAAAAICCYITTLPRRMANRIQEDPSADPEQDIFGFVSEGIDHAGLLALRAPRPTLVGSALQDFFPIEGARESFAEAKRFYEVAGAADRMAMVEAPGGHGLSAPLRSAVYAWFDRWLAGRTDTAPEFAVRPRTDPELQVCADGQVNISTGSRPFLPMVWQQFENRPKPPRSALERVLRIDLEEADPRLVEVLPARKPGQTVVVCVNGNETAAWQDEEPFIRAAGREGYGLVTIDPRGVGAARPALSTRTQSYTDPLGGVEENLAYNAFLVGKCLLGMRVADVLAALSRLKEKDKTLRIVLCGRGDAALVACLAAALDRQVERVGCEEMLLSFRALFAAEGRAINAAGIPPGLLKDFGDIADVIAQVAPRKVLLAAGIGPWSGPPKHVRMITQRFSDDPHRLLWEPPE